MSQMMEDAPKRLTYTSQPRTVSSFSLLDFLKGIPHAVCRPCRVDASRIGALVAKHRLDVPEITSGRGHRCRAKVSKLMRSESCLLEPTLRATNAQGPSPFEEIPRVASIIGERDEGVFATLTNDAELIWTGDSKHKRHCLTDSKSGLGHEHRHRTSLTDRAWLQTLHRRGVDVVAPVEFVEDVERVVEIFDGPGKPLAFLRCLDAHSGIVDPLLRDDKPLVKTTATRQSAGKVEVDPPLL